MGRRLRLIGSGRMRLAQTVARAAGGSIRTISGDRGGRSASLCSAMRGRACLSNLLGQKRPRLPLGVTGSFLLAAATHGVDSFARGFQGGG
jgi:hypothetical protein